ncbi:hypothetical protein BJY01DRAFT_59224 [Aspergillus pseudoustus]|uniref:Alcohol acetyltransferase n=1 Tax=Aspergillus pseudoustus TaxID=1810923 RepID=A0ABR4J8D6_9EURO
MNQYYTYYFNRHSFNMAKDSTLPAIRPTGYLERYYIAQHHVNFHTKVELTASYRVPKSLILSQDTDGFERVLHAALAETISHHPIMCVVLEGYGTSKPKWRRLNEINLRRLVTVVDGETSPLEWIQKEHCLSFDRIEELPLWRIVAAIRPERGEQEQHVQFNLGGFFFHGIADGISTAAFQLTFLDALNKLAEGNLSLSSKPLDIAAIIQVPQQPLLPTLEMKRSLRLEPKFMLKTIFRELIHPVADHQHWSGPVVSDSPGPVIPNFRLSSIPWPVVDKLVSRCRLEKTTITALIVTLVAKRVAALYPDYAHFSGCVPYSLRKFTGHGPRDMGCYVSSTRVAFSSRAVATGNRGFISCAPWEADKEEGVDDPRMWDRARECSRHIRNAVSTRSNHTVTLLKYVADLRKYFLDMHGRERKYSFETTNIGVIDGGLGEDGLPMSPASFDKAIFTGNVSKYSGPFCLAICTVKYGLMTVALGWEQGLVGDETAEGLGTWLEARLMSLGSKSTST